MWIKTNPHFTFPPNPLSILHFSRIHNPFCWYLPIPVLQAHSTLQRKPSSMRGTKTFTDIFSDAIPQGNRKGRNTDLVVKRNDCLLHRYYYYGNFTDKRFDVILEQLHEEFFLSVDTVSRILKENVPAMRELKKKAPDKYYLQSRWPHLKWWAIGSHPVLYFQ